MGEMALRGKSELIADVGYRGLRAHQSIERPLDAHRVCIKGGGHAGIFAKKLEKMRTRKAGITGDGVEFDALGEAVVQKAKRFADAEIQSLRRPRSGPGTALCPRRVKTGVEKLVQIPMDDPITRCRHKGMGKTSHKSSGASSRPGSRWTRSEGCRGPPGHGRANDRRCKPPKKARAYLRNKAERNAAATG